MRKVSDYTGYDYKADFWGGDKRKYEDLCEKETVSKLINLIPNRDIDVLLDIGCGFGRLFPVYEKTSKKQILMDFALTMVQAAQEDIGPQKNLLFLNGNAYSLPIGSGAIDAVISVRTLHHMSDPELFFSEAKRVLKEGAHFIFEIPNKRHLLNILRMLIGKGNPFSRTPKKYSETFYNYHPAHIFDLLEDQGLTVVSVKNTNFFRIPLLKKIVPARLLLKMDMVLQSVLSRLNLAPSIFVLCRKT